MPFLSLTKGAKRSGIQTFARARLLPEPLQAVEMDYLDMRDWYVNQVGLIAQLEEARVQAKADRDFVRAKELINRLQGEQGKLTDFRDRTRMAGERSWAEAFYLSARHMLPKEALIAIEQEADKLLGRPRHELARQDR